MSRPKRSTNQGDSAWKKLEFGSSSSEGSDDASYAPSQAPRPKSRPKSLDRLDSPRRPITANKRKYDDKVLESMVQPPPILNHLKVENSPRFNKIIGASKEYLRDYFPAKRALNPYDITDAQVISMVKDIVHNEKSSDWISKWTREMSPAGRTLEPSCVVEVLNVLVFEAAGFGKDALTSELVGSLTPKQVIADIQHPPDVRVYPLWSKKNVYQTFPLDLIAVISQLLFQFDIDYLFGLGKKFENQGFLDYVFMWLNPIATCPFGVLRHAAVHVTGSILLFLHIYKEYIKKQYAIDENDASSNIEWQRKKVEAEKLSMRAVSSAELEIISHAYILCKRTSDLRARIKMCSYSFLYRLLSCSIDAGDLRIWKLEEGHPDVRNSDRYEFSAIDATEIFKTALSGNTDPEIILISCRAFYELLDQRYEWAMADSLGQQIRTSIVPSIQRMIVNIPHEMGPTPEMQACSHAIVYYLAKILMLLATKDISLIDVDLLHGLLEILLMVDSVPKTNYAIAGLIDAVVFTKPISDHPDKDEMPESDEIYESVSHKLVSGSDDAADKTNIDSIIEFFVDYFGNKCKEEVCTQILHGFFKAFWKRCGALKRVDLMVQRLKKYTATERSREGSRQDMQLADTMNRDLLVLNLIHMSIQMTRRDLVYEIVPTERRGGTIREIEFAAVTLTKEISEVKPLIRRHADMHQIQEDLVNFYNDAQQYRPMEGIEVSEVLKKNPELSENLSATLKSTKSFTAFLMDEDGMQCRRDYIDLIHDRCSRADELGATPQLILDHLTRSSLEVWGQLITQEDFRKMRKSGDASPVMIEYLAVLSEALFGLEFAVRNKSPDLAGVLMEIKPFVSLLRNTIKDIDPRDSLVIEKMSQLIVCIMDVMDLGANNESETSASADSSLVKVEVFKELDSIVKRLVEDIKEQNYELVQALDTEDTNENTINELLVHLKNYVCKLAAMSIPLSTFYDDDKRWLNDTVDMVYWELYIPLLEVFQQYKGSMDELTPQLREDAAKRKEILDSRFLGSLLSLLLSKNEYHWTKIQELLAELNSVLSSFKLELIEREPAHHQLTDADATKRRRVEDTPASLILKQIHSHLTPILALKTKLKEKGETETEDPVLFLLSILRLEEDEQRLEIFAHGFFNIVAKERLALFIMEHLEADSILFDEKIEMFMLNENIITKEEQCNVSELRSSINVLRNGFKKFIIGDDANDDSTLGHYELDVVAVAVENAVSKALSNPKKPDGMTHTELAAEYFKVQYQNDARIIPLHEIAMFNREERITNETSDDVQDAIFRFGTAWRLLYSFASCEMEPAWTMERSAGTRLLVLLTIPNYAPIAEQALSTLLLSKVIDKTEWCGKLSSVALPHVLRELFGNAIKGDKKDVALDNYNRLVEMIIDFARRLKGKGVEYIRVTDTIKFMEESFSSIQKLLLRESNSINDISKTFIEASLIPLAKILCSKSKENRSNWDFRADVERIKDDARALSLNADDNEDISSAVDLFLAVCLPDQ